MTNAGTDKYAPPENPALPPSDMKLNLQRAALLVTDPQVDFLSPKGVTWDLVGESVREQNTVPNIGRLLAAAKQAGIPVVISPHYYFPTDHGWRFEGALEKVMHSIGMFGRKGPLTLAALRTQAPTSCRNTRSTSATVRRSSPRHTRSTGPSRTTWFSNYASSGLTR